MDFSQLHLQQKQEFLFLCIYYPTYGEKRMESGGNITSELQQKMIIRDN